MNLQETHRKHIYIVGFITISTIFIVLGATYIIPWFQIDRKESKGVVEASVPSTLFEGAENGLINVTAQTDGVNVGTGLFSTLYTADDKPHSFRFLLDGFSMQDEWLMLNTPVTVGTGSLVRYMSMQGRKGDGETSLIQVSNSTALIPPENTWNTVYSKLESSQTNETTFTQKEVSIASYAGQTVRVRFLYHLDPGHNWFWQNWEDAGWFIDQIQVTDVTLDGSSTPSDTTAPILTLISPSVASTTASTTPLVIFDSNEAGTITYGGDCASSQNSAIIGTNIIKLNALTRARHSNCTIRVTDAAGNASSIVTLPELAVTLRSDATLNGIVNGGDYNRLVANYNTATCLQSLGDFNGSCFVNGGDYNILVGEYGQSI